MAFVNLSNTTTEWTPLPEEIDERIRNGIRTQANEKWRPVLNPIDAKVLSVEVKFSDAIIEEITPEELDDNLVRTCIEYGYQGAMHKNVRQLAGVPILYRQSTIIALDRHRRIIPLPPADWDRWRSYVESPDPSATRMLVYQIRFSYPSQPKTQIQE